MAMTVTLKASSTTRATVRPRPEVVDTAERRRKQQRLGAQAELRDELSEKVTRSGFRHVSPCLAMSRQSCLAIAPLSCRSTR